MSKKTTAKPRQRVDDFVWQLFVKACGGGCCACFRENLSLHRGHIQRHADGGTTIFENLIPLCKSCNSKYKSGFTPDGRPAAWRDTFVKLFLTEMRLGIMCQHIQLCVGTSATDQAIENTKLLDLQAVQFVTQIHYSTHAGAHTSPRMTAADASKLVWRLFDKSKQTTLAPKRPLGKRQDAMKLLAIHHREGAFMLAGEEFLREAPWVVGNEERGGAYAAADSWQHFCESFDGYLADATARAARLAAQAKVDQERKLEDRARGIVYEREMRWRDYIRTADVPTWPGMLDADAQIIAEVAARKAAATEPQDVGEEDFQISLAVFRRWKLFTSDVLLCQKQRLRVKLAQCVKWAGRYDAEMQKDYAATIKAYTDWLDRAKTMEEVTKDEWRVDELHSTLDPDVPLGDDF